ncbi:EI24 domain-containing protein [Natronosporangium hydrolyticum]|uniref:EI24 domain-containing protein n=1 Tax=Natronosporangium hydrolyticum TaxID=2811111 RepID=A0A895YBZ5_9ACTN|nr:EI24 domain-containing protein [Natronosporangium hydrolyticum]QSB13742.1 EI24 domain-containing protein [Natronosporangium hydrolyticum]
MVGEFVRGAGLLLRGIGMWSRSPRLFLLGLIPVAVTAALFLIGLVALLLFLPDLAAAVTWFAADWSETARGTTRVLAGVALLGVALLIGIVSFTAVTLTLGSPFYERISQHVERSVGELPPELPVGFWRSLGRSVTDSARLLAVTIPIGLCLFLIGFLPAVGQLVAPVLGALIGGWFLALELVSIPFERRGLRLADRRRALRRLRPASLGFGAAVFLCFLIPGGAILVMPAAVAGGTLLARRALSPPT